MTDDSLSEPRAQCTPYGMHWQHWQQAHVVCAIERRGATTAPLRSTPVPPQSRCCFPCFHRLEQGQAQKRHWIAGSGFLGVRGPPTRVRSSGRAPFLTSAAPQKPTRGPASDAVYIAAFAFRELQQAALRASRAPIEAPEAETGHSAVSFSYQSRAQGEEQE